MEEVFRSHANERLGKRAMDLPPQRVEVLSRRGAIHDAHVVRALGIAPHPTCRVHHKLPCQWSLPERSHTH